MAERDTMLKTITEKLREVPGVAMVTRSLRKAASINAMPSVTIIDLGDMVDEVPTGPAIARTTKVALAILHQGSSEEKAPDELAAFADEVRSVMAGTGLRQALDPAINARIFEQSVSEMQYPKKTSAGIVGRQILFHILYVTDARL